MRISSLCIVGLLAALLTACGGLPRSSTLPTASGSTLTCNNAPNPQLTQYVIGYGSLMQEESRKRTAPNAAAAFPVEIQGFHRGWFAKGSDTGFSTTFLGAIAETGNSFNAVVFTVSAAELSAIDQRESGYCRSEVNTGQLSALSNTPLNKGQYWIYLNKPDSMAMPSQSKPLVQSYVDIFIGGCLEQQNLYQLNGFAERCIRSTSGWSSHWVNDRLYPRRPFIYQPKAGQIDALLKQLLPGIFSSITIE